MNPFLVAVLGYAGIVVASAFVVWLIVALGKSNLWLPFVLDHVTVADSALSAQEAAFLEGRGKELAALGFRPVLTYRLTNGPRPLLVRVWLDPTATIICTAQGMTTSERWEARFLSMASYGAGEAAVTTSNMPGVSVFAAMPMQKSQEAVGARTADALLTAHRAAVEQSGLVSVPQEEATVFNEIVRRQRSFCEFQERRGVLRRDESRSRWLGTFRAHARTILGQLLPAAADLKASNLIPAILAGSVVPAAVVLWSYRLGGAWILISLPAIFASGFVASVVFTARAWPWAFILGALPLLSGRWLGPAPAVLLFCGTIVGNWITLRLKGLIAPQPGGRRRMVKMIVLWAALAILFVFFYSFFSRQTAHHRRPGEGAKTNAPFLGRDAAADFQRASEQAFGECPDVECLRKAAKTCAPAHLAENYSTIEGTLASRDTFVLKLGTQCSVVGFLDFTADYSGGCRLLERTCSTLESMRSDSWDREGCSQVVLQTLTPCTRP